MQRNNIKILNENIFKYNIEKKKDTNTHKHTQTYKNIKKTHMKTDIHETKIQQVKTQ